MGIKDEKIVNRILVTGVRLYRNASYNTPQLHDSPDKLIMIRDAEVSYRSSLGSN